MNNDDNTIIVALPATEFRMNFCFCALDFIEKPIGIDELKEAISRYKTLAATGSKKILKPCCIM